MSVPAASKIVQGPITAYVCTEQGACLARELASNIGTEAPRLHGGGVSGAARVSTPASSTDILLTEIGNLPLPVACESVAEIHSSGARVVVFGHQNDITTYRAIVAAGAVDYFPFPVSAAEVLDALSAGAANDPTPAFDPSLRIAVTGSNGGVGASILAQNLAFVSATRKGTPRQTALVDADLRFNSVACDLNRNPTHGFLEALSAPDRVDETFLKATMDQVGARLFLYSAHLHHSGDMAGADEGLSRLIPRLSEHFEASLIDAPRDLLLRHPALLKRLTQLVLVVPGGYSGVHSAIRMLDFIQDAAPDLPVIPVLAELRRDAGLKPRDLSKALDRDVRFTLPRTDQAMARAHRAGAPLCARQPRASYAKAVAGIWDHLSAGPDTPKATKGLLRRVLG